MKPPPVDSTIRRARRGYMLIELTMATLLLAAAMVLTVQMLGWAASERRAVDRRERAAQEASNIMERLSALPWDRLTSDAAAAVQLSASASKALPRSKLVVTVKAASSAADTDLPAKRISIELRWSNRSGIPEEPLRLTAWVYQPRRTQP